MPKIQVVPDPIDCVPTCAEERRQIGVRNVSILHCRRVNQPPQNVVVSDLLHSSPRNRNGLFLSNRVSDSRDQLGAATKHPFQFCDGRSPSRPRDVVVEGKNLSQTRCIVSDLVCHKHLSLSTNSGKLTQ